MKRKIRTMKTRIKIMVLKGVKIKQYGSPRIASQKTRAFLLVLFFSFFFPSSPFFVFKKKKSILNVFGFFFHLLELSDTFFHITVILLFLFFNFILRGYIFFLFSSFVFILGLFIVSISVFFLFFCSIFFISLRGTFFVFETISI